MTLAETFDLVRPCLVAFIAKAAYGLSGAGPQIPPILGTGFFVGPTGLVATNRHVVESFTHVPRDIQSGEAAVAALIFPGLDANGNPSEIIVADVDNWWRLCSFSETNIWYAETVPELALVQLKVSETPSLFVDYQPGMLRTGLAVATAGFLSGDLGVRIHGEMKHVEPLLHRGTVSGLFPFGVSDPDGFVLEAALEAGAPGSPVFLEDQPVVVGMVQAVHRDHEEVIIATGAPSILVPLTANLSVGLPGHLLATACQEFLRVSESRASDFPTLASLIANASASPIVPDAAPDGSDSAA